ncbi:MAG: ATP-dependent DNA helicase RecG [Synergistaceae bacterium]|nr:ATP-dependent DNA helicase RecG [Synergistaceae bacterium]
MPTLKKSSVRLSSPVTVIDGIGPKKAAALSKLNVQTLEDLFFLIPRRYEDRRFPKPLCELEEGEAQCAVAGITELYIHDGRTEALLSDDTDSIRAVWFTDKIGMFVREGMRLALYGNLEYNHYHHRLCFLHPEFEILRPSKPPEIIGKIFAIYPGTAELNQRTIKKFVDTALNDYADKCLVEFMPAKIIQKFGMMTRKDAVIQIHRPLNEDMFIRARNRLAFEEFFVLQTGIIMRRNELTRRTHAKVLRAGRIYESFIKSLTFEMTHAQENAIHEILSDIEKDIPMNRLLQGDVGSGKTLVAAAAITAACDSGSQSAFMAPTEILAQQHYIKLRKNFESLGLNVVLLTGSLRASERRKVLADIEYGAADIIIGTHALFSEDVKFHSLSLVIIDEQHRFGVIQRGRLTAKGESPHVLAMTATPIPRTLIMSVYGGLDVSVLNELPRGRRKIKTLSFMPAEFIKLPEIIREHVNRHEQVYWVCPFIDENDATPATVNETYELLKDNMPDIRIAMLHGRMNINDKARIMNEFSSGLIDLLVSTSIIEVGVDVPNASLMIIQDAERFGLAQLHQLRGRIGRGTAQSTCILLEDRKVFITGGERIASMVDIADGFELAERDLTQRGPGEICGIRQHGINEFRVADLVHDEKILILARDEAKALLNDDPELESEPLLKREIIRRLGNVLELGITA